MYISVSMVGLYIYIGPIYLLLPTLHPHLQHSQWPSDNQCVPMSTLPCLASVSRSARVTAAVKVGNSAAPTIVAECAPLQRTFHITRFHPCAHPLRPLCGPTYVASLIGIARKTPNAVTINSAAGADVAGHVRMAREIEHLAFQYLPVLSKEHAVD